MGGLDVLLFAPSQRPRPWESSPAECVGMQSVLPQDHPPTMRGLWPIARRTRKLTRELQPGPGPISHSTWVTLNPFPVHVDGGFLEYLCLKEAPVDVAQMSVVWVCPHPRGEQAGWMVRVQAAQASHEDPTSSRVSPLSRMGTRAGTCLLVAEFRAGRSRCHTGQAQLSKLQEVLADAQCHFRDSKSMWPMRGAPHLLPRGRHRITTTLPMRPSAGSR